ncbi:MULTISPECIES: LysR family transcriptional regulator [unclassified Pseudomonas]|uniref:LysR family transcriptional regulator n=1 Tax=unclassified Pseudomonas TaxID=196821 RepID=UPI0019130D03|nr:MULTISPECIES: LysR substrate-binding domain-containing protein [unclassified Pseudomonas]MBK5552953.1 LysR family transcriptional regulator [Pseudomonas sp. TH03]MEB0224672.1 LysR substrate-binding domain-containing protein [Pseudomonas sp. 5S1]MEB0294671.1 LysR substrate-binding domain-containing protein [Pseudomonas sp. 10S4]WPX16923.1 LysR substrate-binding domain-containing protein [Pseudomonas sp. 10S4]
MDIRHFRYFLAVARQRNFTRAAEQLGIAPPTLSRQIQDMETELGTRLFLRRQRDVSLTEAGAALVIEAEATVRQFEFAQRNAQRAGRGDIGHIELGYVASAVYSGLLQKQVQAFSRQCPDVSLNVRESPMAALPGLVIEGRFDIGYVRSPMTLPDGLEAIRLDSEGFVLALSSDSWLCRLPQISPAHLQNETFILPEQISGTLQVAAQGGFAPTLGAQPGGLVAVIALVSLGQGVAVVPESVVGHVGLPGVVYRVIEGCEASSWLSMVYRRFEKSAVVARYIEQIRNS